ncbi:hypothetical protein QJQ45_017708 [Haematococcus lacustris]|nr:hypothetical protein QJQ45_017708 [Haematococcus lacustris]
MSTKAKGSKGGLKWDEANLDENEKIKSELPVVKITEPKTPYHAPLDVSPYCNGMSKLRPAQRKKLAAGGLMAAHGERFMAMFDDYDEEHVAASRSATRPAKKARTGTACTSLSLHTGTAPSDYATGPVPSDRQPTLSHTVQSSTGHIVEEVVFSPRAAARSAASTSAAMGSGSLRCISQQGAGQSNSTLRSHKEMAQERKLFMSAKVGKVHQAVPDGDAGGTITSGRQGAPNTDQLSADTAEELETRLSSQDFERIQLEVARLGASGLDKRARKQWQAAMLARLGMKPDKAPRMALNVSKPRTTKAAQQAAKELELARAAGMATRKGQGQAQRVEAGENVLSAPRGCGPQHLAAAPEAAAAKAKGKDWGLQELGKGFKNGVLRMSPLSAGSAASGSRAPRGAGASRGTGRGTAAGRKAIAVFNPVRARRGGKGGRGGKGKKKPQKLPF